MNEWLWIAGLIVCTALHAGQLILGGHLVLGLATALVEHWWRPRTPTAYTLHGLAQFFTEDGKLWTGEVSGVHITLESPDGPPSAQQARQVEAIFRRLSEHVEAAKVFLAQAGAADWLPGCDFDLFETPSLTPSSDRDFSLELWHPDDPHAAYRVEFEKGTPVDWGRDD